jgi:hypothetical protein
VLIALLWLLKCSCSALVIALFRAIVSAIYSPHRFVLGDVRCWVFGIALVLGSVLLLHGLLLSRMHEGRMAWLNPCPLPKSACSALSQLTLSEFFPGAISSAV